MRHRYSVTYLLIGILFGMCFPVGALVLDFIIHDMSFSMINFREVVSNNPLHYMIFSAPLFLGLFALLGGVSRDKAYKTLLKMEKMLLDLESSQDENNKLLKELGRKHDIQSKVMDEIHMTTKVLSDTGSTLTTTMDTVSIHEEKLHDSHQAISSDIKTINTYIGDLVQTTKDDFTLISGMHEICLAMNENALENYEVSKETSCLIEENYQMFSKLYEESKEAGQAIQLVNQISKQIDLLSLNASIEAARVGALGKGFMVIADEIKKLSSQTQEATLHIDASVGSMIQKMDDMNGKMSKILDNGLLLDKTSSESLKAFKAVCTNSSQLYTNFSSHNENTDLLNHVSDRLEFLMKNASNHTSDLSMSLQSSKTAINNNDNRVIELKEILTKIG
ncbi:methyl-accepting chemotaxis protein [Acidaminobacter sp. JC074]|uniref:methyl-accepting chemotaxis protein n=1 Tax=Acidaminobacter sp. JC074 TaxID=2530199 RepID=UPI001F0FBB25|nr:methyl-accepting chemotaxis protein [Acidaminobacter sp. JC074]MCH4888130.1 methyl-accepting chemotaxis protein [Acidaminobacter sp. JC074]